MTDFKDYLPENSTRKREDIEWCIFYSFNAADDSSLRVLTVGDSICYQYKEFLRDELADIMNLTSWATSKCVTDVNYIKDLKNILEYNIDVVANSSNIYFIAIFFSYKNNSCSNATIHHYFKKIMNSNPRGNNFALVISCYHFAKSKYIRISHL